MTAPYLTASLASSGTVLGFYYVLGAIAAGLACVVAARQLLKRLKDRWVSEDQREQTLRNNTLAVKAFGDKLDMMVDKMTDHDNRISWLEQQQAEPPKDWPHTARREH